MFQHADGLFVEYSIHEIDTSYNVFIDHFQWDDRSHFAGYFLFKSAAAAFRRLAEIGTARRFGREFWKRFCSNSFFEAARVSVI